MAKAVSLQTAVGRAVGEYLLALHRLTEGEALTDESEIRDEIEETLGKLVNKCEDNPRYRNAVLSEAVARYINAQVKSNRGRKPRTTKAA